MYGIAFMDSPRQGLLAGAEGLAILAFALWLAPRTYGSHGQLTAMAGRVQRLAQTRKDDVAAAELRRVERDLHDGAQARLVALGMSLRAAERLIHTNPMAAQALVAEARDASSRALTDLRDLVRGIYPPVLADRGLGDAIQALALDTRSGPSWTSTCPDGRPGPAAGTGLLGVERRLGTSDGVLAVSSPPGGPTIVVIEVPCELSSPKTFSS
jgi:signal transduction histidine kinase